MIIICVNAYTSLLRAWRRAQRCSRRAHPELQSVLERGAGRRLGTTRLLQMPGDAVEVPEMATRHVAGATLALLHRNASVCTHGQRWSSHRSLLPATSFRGVFVGLDRGSVHQAADTNSLTSTNVGQVGLEPTT